MKDLSKYIPFAEKACEFFTASPDNYHVVQNNVDKLKAAGYQQLSKREPIHAPNYEELRTKFDQQRPVIATNTIQDKNISTQASIQHQAQ